MQQTKGLVKKTVFTFKNVGTQSHNMDTTTVTTTTIPSTRCTPTSETCPTGLAEVELDS